MRKLNLVFLVSLVLVLFLLGGAAYLVRGRQVQRNASSLFDRAKREEQQGLSTRAVEALKQYLSLRPRDSEGWRSYARLIDETTKDPRRRQQVYLVYQEALRYNLDDPALQRRCVDLALELRPERTGDARRLLKSLISGATESLEKGKEVNDVARAALELAELKELDGKCLLLDSDFPAAASAFAAAISYDPTRIFCYVQLARLDRKELRKDTKDADGEIEWMIANNPRSGLAHLDRFRYLTEFRPPAPDGELKQALELAPEDPEILLTAALAAEHKKDLAAARGCFEKGLKLHPRIVAFPMALAELETRDGHLDRAESVLRQADQANPSPDIAFRLAENLIAQNKIDAGNQTESYINRLREAGLGETLVRYLEAQILVQRRQWAEAIPKIETTRALLRSLPQLEAALDLWLVECYTHVGTEEKRLEALRAAAEGKTVRDSTRAELARALARAGKLDDAIAVLIPLAERVLELRLDFLSVLIQKAGRTPRDPGAWREVERQLSLADKTLPGSAERLTLLRADMLAARDRMDEARKLLTATQSKDPRSLPYRLALARLSQRQGKGPESLKILDEAEKELGPSLAIQLARLDHWGLQGDDAAKAAVARMAETTQQLAAADRPAFLARLAVTEIRLREPALARQHLAELAALRTDDFQVRLTLFDLAIEAGDHEAAAEMVQQVRKIEGDKGTHWRFAQATLWIDEARRGKSNDHLEAAQRLAAEICEQRPDWWAGPTLRGELADLAGSPDQAVEHYLQAVDLGNAQPPLARRLVALLNERNRISDIDRVAKLLGERGVALNEITLIKAVEALRRQDFDQAIALARQVYSENSTNPTDHLALGRFYASAKQSDAAAKEFQRAVELGPGVPDVWLAYVQHLVQSKQIEKAKSTIEVARQALPAERATLTLAQCWMAVGDLKQAEELVGTALSGEGKSSDPDVLKTAVLLALSQNQLHKVDEYLTKLGQGTNPSAGDKAWVNRIRVAQLLNKGRMADQDQALLLIEQNLRDNPNNIEDQRLKASMLALRASRQGEAVKILQQLGSSDSLHAKEQFLLARLYLLHHEEHKYEDEMTSLLKLKPGSPQFLIHFVNYWISKNRLAQSDRWLSELKRIDPQGTAVLELEARLLDLRKHKAELLSMLQDRRNKISNQTGLVADLLSRYGFISEAEEAYRAFIALDPKQPERNLALARLLAREGRVAESMEILRKAWIDCKPEQVSAASLEVYSASAITQADKRQIESWLSAAVRNRPDLVLLASKLGIVWIHEGRFDEAEALFRRLLSDDPDDVETLNNLGWLLALRSPDKAGEAIELLNRAIDIQGETATLCDTRAVARIVAGQSDQAAKDLELVRKQAPGKPSYALHLAWAYHSGGQSEQARSQLQDAERLGLKTLSLDPLELANYQRLLKELAPG